MLYLGLSGRALSLSAFSSPSAFGWGPKCRGSAMKSFLMNGGMSGEMLLEPPSDQPSSPFSAPPAPLPPLPPAFLLPGASSLPSPPRPSPLPLLLESPLAGPPLLPLGPPAVPP